MAKKYDYQMKAITIDEAMEILGYTSVDRFVIDLDKHLPSHAFTEGEVDIYSMSEVTAMASSIGKEVSIPDEIKSRCIVEEIEKKNEIPEEHAVQKRLEHPYMEDGKCLEHCGSRDDYGFCKYGDRCPRYNVSNITGLPIVEDVEPDEVSKDNSSSITALEINSILGKVLRDMVDEKKSTKEHDRVMRDSLAVASVAKIALGSIDITMKGAVAIKACGRTERDFIRNLLV